MLCCLKLVKFLFKSVKNCGTYMSSTSITHRLKLEISRYVFTGTGCVRLSCLADPVLSCLGEIKMLGHLDGT